MQNSYEKIAKLAARSESQHGIVTVNVTEQACSKIMLVKLFYIEPVV